jgi:hypothetical protein
VAQPAVVHVSLSVQVAGAVNFVQLDGQASQTFEVALFTYPALHLAAVQAVPVVHSEQLAIHAVHPLAPSTQYPVLH